jgi:CRP/FNR family transcriptional regulator
MPQPTDTEVASVPIFSRISPDDLALVAAIAQVRAYAPGEQVFAEGEPAQVLLAVLSGSIRVRSASGGPVLDLPEVLHPGDPLGDVGAFEGGPYPASGIAAEPTSCLVIPRSDFFRLLEQSPTLVRGFVHGLTHRIVELTRELRLRS